MVAPIVGKMRKRLLLDLTVSLGLGTAGAYTWWYGYHVPKMQRIESVYEKIRTEKIKAAEA